MRCGVRAKGAQRGGACKRSELKTGEVPDNGGLVKKLRNAVKHEVLQ